MKSACKTLKWCIWINIILFIITASLTCTFLHNEANKYIKLLLEIFIGLFGSGFIALLLSIPAYNVNKRQLLEKYWQEVKRLTFLIGNIKYLYSEMSRELVVNYINEKNNNKLLKRLEEDGIKVEYLNKRKKELEAEYISRNEDFFQKLPKKRKDLIAERNINMIIERICKEGKEICQQYIKLAKDSTLNLNFMLGDMEFISGSKEYEKIYERTYKPLLDIFISINEEKGHFELFMNGEGNEAIVIDKIFKLQDSIFKVQIEEDERSIHYTINNKIMDSLLEELELLRSRIFNVKPEKLTLYSVETRVSLKSNYDTDNK